MAQTVLVLEDTAPVALILEDELAAAGFAVAGPFAFAAKALRWLETAAPDAAVLDVMVNDGSCHPVVEALRDRGVPFLIFSSRDPSEPAWADFADAPWIGKPASFCEIVAALRRVMAGEVV